jgi:Flp pilus assembly pilin Flp
MRELLTNFVIDETAATRAEFSLLVVGIGLAIGSVLFQIGPDISWSIEHVVGRIGGE